MFIEELDNLIGDKLSTYKVPVSYRNPDKDLINETFPMISFFDFNITPSYSFSNHTSIVERNTKEGTITVQEGIKQYYDVMYQIDIWTDNKQDLNNLISKHIKEFKRHGYLDENETIPYSVPKFTYQNSDTYANNRRIFRRCFTIKCTVPLERDILNKPMITKLDIRRY